MVIEKVLSKRKMETEWKGYIKTVSMLSFGCNPGAKDSPTISASESCSLKYD